MHAKVMPKLEETYHPGATLNLYAWQHPAPPTTTRCMFDRPPSPTQLSERYNKSIAERVALPSTPPAVSITLEKRLESSTRRVPHVWSVHVQGSSSHGVAMTTTTTCTTYPPQLVAKIYDPVFFDDEETQWHDPFIVRDFCVSNEIEAYRRLGSLQGTDMDTSLRHFLPSTAGQSTSFSSRKCREGTCVSLCLRTFHRMYASSIRMLSSMLRSVFFLTSSRAASARKTCIPGMSSCGRKSMCRYQYQERGSATQRDAC